MLVTIKVHGEGRQLGKEMSKNAPSGRENAKSLRYTTSQISTEKKEQFVQVKCREKVRKGERRT